MFSSKLLPLARHVSRRTRALNVPAGGASPASSAPSTASPPPSKPEHIITARVARVTPAPPSINSTGLGASPGDIGDIQDPHTHDPLKWRKAAWKYLGAVAVFGAFYKTLHWYVGRVAEEGRRKREDMEVAKTAVFETAADRAAQREADARKAAEMLEMARNPLGEAGKVRGEGPDGVVGVEARAVDAAVDGVSGVEDGAGGGVEDEKDASFELFKSVKEGKGYVSPEDELRVYEAELEGRLKELLEMRSPSTEEREETASVQQQLYDVQAELSDFVGKK